MHVRVWGGGGGGMSGWGCELSHEIIESLKALFMNKENFKGVKRK